MIEDPTPEVEDQRGDGADPVGDQRDRTPEAPADSPVGDAPPPPSTGEAVVDQALESLQGLESEPLSEHHDRLARVHEDLHRALNTEQEQSTDQP